MERNGRGVGNGDAAERTMHSGLRFEHVEEPSVESHPEAGTNRVRREIDRSLDRASIGGLGSKLSVR